MQLGKLGAWAVYLFACLLLSALAPVQDAYAQANLETPQELNDRIRSLSARARLVPHDYVIGNGDVIILEVFDVKELSREVRVSQTGTIGIPLVPVRLHVSGLTEVQAEQKIAEVLETNGLVSHPEVSVTVKERKSKPITVLGAVAHPMVLQADRPITILELLAEAGGVSNDAGETIIITRPVVEAQPESAEPPAIGEASPSDSPWPAHGSGAAPARSPEKAALQAEPPQLTNTLTLNLHDLMETGDATNNLVLQAGDVVTVPHAGIVYVLGAVGHSGGFVLTNDRAQMTTLKILALAGGLTRTAKSDHAVIVRKNNQGQQQEVAVDLKKIMQHQAEDLQLQPSDILVVPSSVSKEVLLRTLEVGIAVATGVALYRVAYH
jgi:polysaccharide export outer membrane protein